MKIAVRRLAIRTAATIFPITLASLGGLFGTSAAAHVVGGALGACLGSVAIASRAEPNERLAIIASWGAFVLAGGCLGAGLFWRMPHPGAIRTFALVAAVGGLAGGVAAGGVQSAITNMTVARMARTVAGFLIASLLFLLLIRLEVLPLGFVLAALAYAWIAT